MSKTHLSNIQNGTVISKIPSFQLVSFSAKFFVHFFVFHWICFGSILHCACVFSCIYRDKHRGHCICVCCIGQKKSEQRANQEEERHERREQRVRQIFCCDKITSDSFCVARCLHSNSIPVLFSRHSYHFISLEQCVQLATVRAVVFCDRHCTYIFSDGITR